VGIILNPRVGKSPFKFQDLEQNLPVSIAALS